MISGAVGGVALNQAIPFNRVWSFPKKIVLPDFYDVEIITDFEMESIRNFSIAYSEILSQQLEKYNLNAAVSILKGPAILPFKSRQILDRMPDSLCELAASPAIPS